MMNEPLPGTLKAQEAGCTCPVMDNNHGEGVKIDGNRQWWVNSECPIHGIHQIFPWMKEPEALP